jgi:hypothetical protein
MKNFNISSIEIIIKTKLTANDVQANMILVYSSLIFYKLDALENILITKNISKHKKAKLYVTQRIKTTLLIKHFHIFIDKIKKKISKIDRSEICSS